MKKRFFASVFSFLMLVLSAWADKGMYTYVVSKGNDGDFKTIAEAIEAIPDYCELETLVFIKRGKYKEKLVIPESKKNVIFQGEAPDSTIIFFDDNVLTVKENGGKMSTSETASLFVHGDDILFENITIANSSGPVGQAVAVYVSGDRITFLNCRIKGFQDTLYTFGKASKQLYRNCYIEGCVDFIFGSSTAFFENCEIHCLRGGYITAASTPKERKYGYVFKDCRITAEEDVVPKVYLGRPWRPYAKTVYIGCTMGNFIKPCGWHNWNSAEKEKTAFYGEYNSRDQNGNPINMSSRVSWLRKVNPFDFTIDKVLEDFNKPGWYKQ